MIQVHHSFLPKCRSSVITRAILPTVQNFFSYSSCSKHNQIPFFGESIPPNHHYNQQDNKNGFSHDNLTNLQKITVALHSATTAFNDPTRADAVASLGEITGNVALSKIFDRMMKDETGLRILTEQPRVNQETVHIDDLSSTKPGTFGYAYAEFMRRHTFDPNERGPRNNTYIVDPRLSYVMLRYRQNHDFWHVLTGLPPTVLGELGLKWLEFIQMGLPVAALSATVGSLRLSESEQKILWDVYLPWAIRVGKEGEFLMNVYYEENFDIELSLLREELRIEAAPEY